VGDRFCVRRKFEMTATASLDLHQGEPNSNPG
jgi:hypothetical protein